jgi:predicted RNase H-like HicB family nuclease
MTKQKTHQALNYSAIFEEDQNGGYSVWIPDLPGCASQGETLDEAKRGIVEAIGLYLEEAPPEYLNPQYTHLGQFIMPIQVSI